MGLYGQLNELWDMLGVVFLLRVLYEYKPRTPRTSLNCFKHSRHSEHFKQVKPVKPS